MDGSTVVIALDPNHFAHFVEAGAQPDSDTIGEGLLAGNFRVVEIVGGEEGHAAIIVAGVDDLGHRVADPVGRFGGAQFIEDEDIGLVNRFENAKFRRLGDRVVTVLDLLEQVTKIIEEAADSLLEEGIEGSNSEVSLPDTAGPHQEESDIEDGVFPDQFLRVRQGVRLRAKDLVDGEVVTLGMIVLEGAALIASGEARAPDQLGTAFRVPAVAGANALAFDWLPSCPLTQPTIHTDVPDRTKVPDRLTFQARSSALPGGECPRGLTEEAPHEWSPLK